MKKSSKKIRLNDEAKLEEIIEDLTINNELNAKIDKNLVKFNNISLMNKDGSKTRLFGIIRLRKEINLKEAVEFLNLT